MPLVSLVALSVPYQSGCKVIGQTKIQLQLELEHYCDRHELLAIVFIAFIYFDASLKLPCKHPSLLMLPDRCLKSWQRYKFTCGLWAPLWLLSCILKSQCSAVA